VAVPRRQQVLAPIALICFIGGCVGGDERGRRSDTTTTDADTTQLDVPCPDNCAESYPVVPACSRAVWDSTVCQCRLEPLAELSPCDDDDRCTLEDRCVSGVCRGRALDALTACDDGDPCTDDRCERFAGCLNSVVADGAPCDDANDCTYDEACRAGQCRWDTQYVCGTCDTRAADTCEAAYGNGLACDGTLACRAGFCELDRASVPDCADPRLDPCRRSACDPASGQCKVTDRPDGDPCIDRSPCTIDDTCDGGVCDGTRLTVAGCVCERDDDCRGLDDGDLCNGVFRCVDDVCRFDFASIVVCDRVGETACLRASCDPASGACDLAPVDDDSPCDDGSRCTLGDACDAGACVGTPIDCSGLDGLCTRGACDPVLGCVPAPDDTGESCDPSLPCVESGSCQGGACVPLAAPCDDRDACTADACRDDGGCTHEGPPKPACLALGVCAGGVPLACEGGAYRCAYEQVAGFGAVELCDDRDNDCDGDTDEACVDVLACADGALAGAFGGGTMQACRALGGELPVCGAGFHVCSYTQMVKAIDDLTPPAGYLIAASIAFDPSDGWAVNDRPEGGCFPQQGLCSLAREVQAVSHDGVFGGTVAYAAEAWGCAGGEPTGSCDTLSPKGVMCCGDVCDVPGDCDDGSPCTVDTCDLGRGRCVNQDKERPVCKTQGVCAGQGVVCGANGKYTCGYLADARYQEIETACDGLDNDCDGKTDALDPDLATYAPPCDRDVGVCAGARKTVDLCLGGRWRACTAATYLAHDLRYETGVETRCDGLDNDCDGGTDNAFAYGGALVGGACDGVGACGAGEVVCAPDQASATCSTNPDGTHSQALAYEDCNGEDDDCDGATDEPDDLDAGHAGCSAEGVCRFGVPVTCEQGDAAAGIEPGWRCDYDGVAGWHEVERCDGVDDDCDGATDEGYALARDDGEALVLGAACGDGECQGGRVVCASDGDGAACSSDLEGGRELCDGVDNDCNGDTDEGVTFDDWASGPVEVGGACTGRGACAAGVVECGPGLAAVCSTFAGGSASQARAETCNALDDDCDGLTDEGMSYLGIAIGEVCDGRGECGAGRVECTNAGVATCSTNPNGSASQVAIEVCNGKDDDCDGTVDDGVVVAAGDCAFGGVCTLQSGTFTCGGAAGWTCDFTQVPYYQAGHEGGRCDGRDNDCDGSTDEDFPTLGAACDGPDADLCARGTNVCKPDGLGVVCQGDVAQVEACNGHDDDCDGQTDEADALGCTIYYKDQDLDGWGLAAFPQCLCAKPANMAVQAGDCNDGNFAVNPGRPELCNGVDDDCDGATDAAGDAPDLIVDDPRPCESQAGVCAGAMKPASRCVSGAWQPCVPADYFARDARYQVAEATCDGADNDCDGLTDAADPGMAANRPACATQSGVCSGALTPLELCTAAGWGACTSAVYAAHSAFFESGQELSCDGRDNDCDAATDEPFTFGGKAVGQACDGTGACGIGLVQCRADKSVATCSTNPDGTQSQAVPETCNGQDDDCDAQTDEGLGVLGSTCRLVGVCNANNVQASCTQGTWLCSYASVPGYENGVELTCDALDNDCDGATDEDFVLVEGGVTKKKGDPCGGGQCQGAVVCNTTTPAPGDLVCSSSLAGQPEVCDGVDNNCNGATDEGVTWTPPSGQPGAGQPIPKGGACDGIGECGAGTVVCAASQVATCSTNPDGTSPGNTSEVCNGKDDDCDGVLDDGFSWGGVAVGGACDGVGRCGLGVVECLAGGQAATCSTNPNGTQSQRLDELCNGQDDDCDGATDEGLGVFASPCLLTGVCTAQSVVATCNGAGGWACSYAAVPGYHAGDELGFCDGLDNDCDGATDEDYPQIGQACDGGDADLCARGTWSCTTLVAQPVGRAPAEPMASGVPVCVGDVASPEQCGGGDEDCDGVTDEPGALGCKIYFRDADKDGYGVHTDAACLCEPDPTTNMTSQSSQHDCDDAFAYIHPGANEYCDGVDDDCDGQTDEDDALGCEDRYLDRDHDGFGVSDERCLCEDWQGEVTGHTAAIDGDCNDDEPTVYPQAPERCDGLDNDCDGPADEGQNNIDCTVYYRDGDNDGHGSSIAMCLCAPDGLFDVKNQGDCCDADARVYPGQQSYFPNPADAQCARRWDFNCDTVAERLVNNFGSCACDSGTIPCNACRTTTGWSIDALAIPECGQAAPFLHKCNLTATLCLPETRHDVKQSCR